MQLKRFWIGLALGYSVFVYYCTLFPFRFPNWEKLNALEGVIQVFVQAPNISPGDIIQNFLFFIPFGFFLAKGFRKFELTVETRIVLISLISFALSLSAEFFQLATEKRQSSVLDLLFNTLGGLSGNLLISIKTPRLIKFMMIKMKYSLREWWSIPTLGFMVLMLFENWMPFNFTLMMENPLEKMKLFTSLSLDYSQEGIIYIIRMGFLTAVGSSLMCAWLYNLKIYDYLVRACFICIAYGFTLEILQLFIMSRMPSPWEFIIIVTGVITGAIIFEYMPKRNMMAGLLFWSGVGLASGIILFPSLDVYIDSRQINFLNSAPLSKGINHGFQFVTLFCYLSFIASYFLFKNKRLKNAAIQNGLSFLLTFWVTFMVINDYSSFITVKKGLPIIVGIFGGIVVFHWLVGSFRGHITRISPYRRAEITYAKVYKSRKRKPQPIKDSSF